MIHKLILKNFKRIKDETFLFNRFDLLVGANNSGKSTALQALAIWQYCVDQFALSKRSGSNGIQVVLPNFTALPLPEFNLLWTNKIDREYIPDSSKGGGKAQVFIQIEIDVYWKDEKNQEHNFCVTLRYQTPQSIFAKPQNGWSDFNAKFKNPHFPKVVYVPPFSGLEPHEQWMDDGNVKQRIGKAQPGSVLRNLLYRVIDRADGTIAKNEDWAEITRQIQHWFGIDILPPQYQKGVSVEIISEFKSNKKTFDIISGGSGFHQILTLMAFVYGYPEVTTILFDEPDAHLHVNLQRQIVNYFKESSKKQFLIATHSEEFIKGVEIDSVLSMLSGSPHRVHSTEAVIQALSSIDNMDVVRTELNPYILYVEGEDDERILAAWSHALNMTAIYERFYPYMLGGSSKQEMQRKSDQHFAALKMIQKNLKRVILLDQDGEENAINPPENQHTLNEWKRRNIDNYLMVPTAWKRAIYKHFGETEGQPALFSQVYIDLIDEFFENENLTLPKNATWESVTASVFGIVDGKKLLFENAESLFQKIRRKSDNTIKLNRSTIASEMKTEEIHADVKQFFNNLKKITGDE